MTTINNSIRQKDLPTFKEEEKIRDIGYKYILGVDEVGRGSFAGPLVAAGVILPDRFPLNTEINDSKLLSPVKRAKLNNYILRSAIFYTIKTVPVEYINKYGIGKANHFAFKKVYLAIKQQMRSNYILTDKLYLLVDGFKIKENGKDYIKKQKALIHGDSISLSVACASIIAKVYRDNLMSHISDKYPEYRFELNKGYGTKAHIEALRKYGITDIHRTSFALGKYLDTALF